jgi:hypothetical protein
MPRSHSLVSQANRVPTTSLSKWLSEYWSRDEHHCVSSPFFNNRSSKFKLPRVPTQQLYSTHHSPYSTSLASPVNALREIEAERDRNKTGRAMQKSNSRKQGALVGLWVSFIHLFSCSDTPVRRAGDRRPKILWVLVSVTVVEPDQRIESIFK